MPLTASRAAASSLQQTATRSLRRSIRLPGMLATVAEGFFLERKYKLADDPAQPVATRVTQHLCQRLISSMGMTVRVYGETPDTTGLWVSNHISWLDVPVIGSLARVYFLSKAEVADWPVIGKLARAAGTLFIRRGSGDVAQVTGQITETLRQNLSVLFFPEATTTQGRKVRRIHGRLFQAAIDAGKPIQPVVICYTDPSGHLHASVPFISTVTFRDHLLEIAAQSPITAHVKPLPMLDPADYPTLSALTTAVQQSLSQGLEQLFIEAKVKLDQDS